MALTLILIELFEGFASSGAIKAPTVKTKTGKWKIDTDHRFFLDDIHYGLCIAKWAAERLALVVPTIDEIIDWAQKLRHETLIEGGKLKLDSEDPERLNVTFGECTLEIGGSSQTDTNLSDEEEEIEEETDE